jgi:uncharacterized protein (TIGR03437 family)
VSVIQCGVVLCVLGAAVATATPKLRLSTAAVGPVGTTVGANGSLQTVDAYNIGTGTLTLSAAASVTWLSASVGTSTSCSYATSCFPVKISLNTAALAGGLYTGLVTVSAPGAIDAPQNITVTVQVGSGVPNSLNMYVAPGGSASASFSSASTLVTAVTNPTSGPKLSVAVSGGGSFSFGRSYEITATASASTPVGSYSGSVGISGSAQPADNKSVPVTVQVTAQPIAASSSPSVLFRIAQGAAPGTQAVAIVNNGMGTLAVSGVTLSGGPTWLTSMVQGNYVFFTADPTGLTPGVFTATASVASNASNGVVTVPIEMDVLTPGPPVAYYQGVLDNATFAVGATLAPGGIVALFGEQLSNGPPVQASALPLTTSLGGASVTVNGQPAPVYYVSANQIDFLIPLEAASGSATVSVSTSAGQGNSVSVNLAPVAPTLLSLGIGAYGNIVLADLVTRPIPTTPGIASRPAVPGVDTIVIYALGMGQTTPPVADGVAAPSTSPLASVPNVKVVFGYAGLVEGGTASVKPAFAGLAPGFVGLYQINVAVPSNSPVGNTVPLSVNVNGVVSNYVDIAVQ